MKTIGFDWPVGHKSSHPPTAYILVAPIALFSWPAASSAWALLMIGCNMASLKLLGANLARAIGLGLLVLLWPPAAMSLGQLTPIWLLGLALAYRERNGNAFVSGIYVGISSLPKILSGIILVPFIAKRKWSAVFGFILVWIVALSIMSTLIPSALSQYLVANFGNANSDNANSVNAILRSDNGAFLAVMFRLVGIRGVVSGLFILMVLIVSGWRRCGEEEGWYMYSFCPVALLPIAWIYSLFPLLPLLKNRHRNIFTISAFAITCIMPPFGIRSALIMLYVFLLFLLSFYFQLIRQFYARCATS